ncbi:MAG TPA: hypothetical protein VII94_04635 [Candidatus Saccharimonadales bacterium]
MADKRSCSLCGEYLEETPAIHDVAKCEKTELLKGRIEIEKLKASVNSWKDAWHHGREIIGNLRWNHRSIDSDTERAYYQAAQQRIKENKS